MPKNISDLAARVESGPVSRRQILRAGAVVGGGLVAAACAPSGVTPNPSSGASAVPAVTTVVNQGQLQPAPANAAPTGWDTAQSLRLGLQQLATFDDSGPAAWDPAAHPQVYFTSEGQGYTHRPSGSYKLVGFQAIDAVTKKVFAAPKFDLGYKQYGTPHGLGVSPNGQWIYVPTSDNTANAMQGPNGEGRLLVINAKTFKLHQIFTFAREGFHHITAFTDWQGRQRVLLQTQTLRKFILDPNDNNRVVDGYTVEDVMMPMGHPYNTVDPTGKYLYISLSSTPLRDANGMTGIAKVDMEKNTVVTVLGMLAANNIGQAHTADGKFSYFNDSIQSQVYKLDNKTNTFVGKTSAGVAGPYGLTLNWNETEAWSLGKGESSHNTGGNIGIIDTKLFKATNNPEFNQPVDIQGAIIDHVILHPDPAVNEMWVTSAGTWETIVVDATSKKVKARIPSPHGGDTHSGAFVRYASDFKGELLADMGGPQKKMYAVKAEKAAAVK